MTNWLGLPEQASAHAAAVDQILGLIHIVMFALFIGWGAFFLYTLFRFKKKSNPKADYVGVKTHASSYVEVGVAVFEAILLIGLSIPLWSKVMVELPDENEAVRIRVVAQQFQWNIHYPGTDGVFGRTESKLMDEISNPIGLDRTDPAAADDITTINQLHLPVNKPVIVYLTSKDVIHCFALPIMRVKQDIIPGMRIPTAFTPTKIGESEIACAQLCGLGHYRMRGYLTVHTEAEYETWLSEQTAEGQTAKVAAEPVLASSTDRQPEAGHSGVRDFDER